MLLYVLSGFTVSDILLSVRLPVHENYLGFVYLGPPDACGCPRFMGTHRSVIVQGRKAAGLERSDWPRACLSE